MPDSEEGTETKPDKQPTGSSKRKRKQSIKRNIVLDDDTEFEVKKPKVERTYTKKGRGEKKEKSNKDSDESSSKEVQTVDKESTSEPLVKDVGTEMDSVPLNPTDAQEEIKNDAEDKKNSIRSDESDANVLPGGLDSQENKYCPDEQECHESENQDVKESKKSTKGKKKYPCNVCAEAGSDLVFTSNDKLKQHVADSHKQVKEEMKRFHCTECTDDVWFPTKSKFVYHLGTKHPGIIKFICDICTETFKLKANYKIHMKTHNVVVQKKYSCEVCNGTFVNKAGFEAHKRRFPGPHIKQNCIHCGFSFSREKHMRNHRCKTLLIREAEKRENNINQIPVSVSIETEPEEETEKETQNLELENVVKDVEILLDKKLQTESSDETSLVQKQAGSDEDVETSKRVVVHRIIARRNQEPAVYKSVQIPNSQNTSESVVVQELREIDFESGTFIATSTDQDQQFIVRDINGHLLQGNQILQLDLNDVQPGEESQVYLADWNIVAPISSEKSVHSIKRIRKDSALE